MPDRDFTTTRTAGGKARGVPDLPRTELDRLLKDPDEFIWQHFDHPVKIAHESLIVEAELQFTGGPVRVACKRYRPRNRWKAFCWLFRRSRARCAWHLGNDLLARGIATARPLAMCEIRRSWFRPRSYLLTQWIAASDNLHLYGWQLARRPIDQRLRSAARCAESLGRLIGRMHSLHISHRDLKAANLLVAQQEQDDHIETYLVDLDGVRVRRRLSPARRAADLARLAAGMEAHPWVTRPILYRFLRAYIAQFPPQTVAWKPLWRAVASRSRQIAQRKHRRHEPVL